ncbi:serine/threonine-protein kinase [Nocardia mexicana]|uniref:non-specific serine/threonine protein kinase n=1 Tax=Nocardia mexicana TaxID=279262 RepID=A0A370H3X2_9NOCA|nr:serine/threonine-protein kinase [Nocardia mexicana]RDI50853.1 serine/threonine protein kinase [Nocardia mexicana]
MTSDRLIAGRYRLGDPIGTGAMGVVWRATDVRLRRTVAVKQLLLAPGLTRAQALEAKLRAMREGRIAARLHHQNAVTVFDVAEEDGQPWLVMEFVDAQSLAALMRDKGPLDPREVARIGAKVASALTAAHDAGIVHRDVKPANILVADNGTVKITDFGISRAVGDVTVTSTGFLAGTPAYLSPEVARGENPEPASDVFALGSTLYAAVEGKPPFGEGDNPLAVLHSVARAQVPYPQHADALAPVLMELLAADAGNRPNMRESQAALAAVAEGRAAPAPKSATKVLPKPGAPLDAAAATTVLSGTAAGNAEDPTVHVPTGAPPPPSGGTVPAGSPAPQRKPPAILQNRRALGLIAAGAVVVLVVIGLIAALNNGGGGGGTVASESPQPNPGGPVSSAVVAPPGQGEQPTRGQAAAPSTAPGAVPSSGPSPTPSAPQGTTTVPPTTTAPPPPPPVGASAFVANYYGMLPGNVSGAWSMLSPSYQAQTGGYDSYVRFWSQFSSVSASNIVQNGDTAVATITYRYKNGQQESEQRWFRVVNDGGRPLIVGSERG